MQPELNVLILEDSPEDAELLTFELRMADFTPRCRRVDNREDYLNGLREGPDIIIADYSLPGFDVVEALRLRHENAPEIPVIVVSGIMSEEACVECLRHGAVDYLLKDRLTRLAPAVQQAMSQRRLLAERRDAEQAERRTALIMQAVVDGAPAMFYLVDTDGRFVMINDEFERLFAMRRADVIGATARDLPIGEPSHSLGRRDSRCLHRKAVIEAEETITAADGERIYLSIRYPLTQADGSIHAIAALYTDITRQKRIEADLRHARTELQRQAADLARSNSELQELDRLKSQFLATVSHELRTPLTSIRGYTELLAEGRGGQLSPVEQHIVGVIDQEGKRLLVLIEDLLSFARVENGALPLSRHAVDVTELIQRCCVAVGPSVSTAMLTLVLELQDDLPIINADTAQLERVVLNLLSNAVKFTPQGGSVTVGAQAHETTLTLTISDTGVGIPLNEQKRLFTRFFRASTAEEHHVQGTGLGLAICKAIVEAHGGTIAAVSSCDTGTTITVTLSIDARSVDADTEPASGTPAVTAPADAVPVFLEGDGEPA